MALCPNGQNPTIEWQYPGEDKQRIIGADNYSTQANTPNFTGGQCEGGYIVYCVWDGIRRVAGYQEGKITKVDCTVFQISGPQHLRGYGVVIRNDKGAVKSITDTSSLPNSNIYRVDIEPTSGSDNCGNLSATCDFKVFKNGAIVYQKSTPTCPTVTYFCGDRCPPGTCQCDCGSEVCCYDTATGKAVKSFRK